MEIAIGILAALLLCASVAFLFQFLASCWWKYLYREKKKAYDLLWDKLSTTNILRVNTDAECRVYELKEIEPLHKEWPEEIN
jgi:hypothetical protein